MATITSQSQLNVGIELIIDEVARTIELVEAGNLIAKDGVSLQALYSKLVSLWNTASYQDSPFPMTAGNVKAGDYQFGVDAGGVFNGWAPANDATRNMFRNGGWNEFDAAGTLLRAYAGFVGLGTINTGAQPYYILETGDAPTNFPFDDQFNVGIQTYGDALNGNFDKRAAANNQAKAFVREEGKLYFDSVLSDTGSTIGPDIATFLIANRDDSKIQDTDANVSSNLPYTGINITYYATDQQKTVGGSDYPFRVVIEGNGASLEDIYTKVQYLLRQPTDIDEGAGTVIGQTADLLLSFSGDTLTTAPGVYVENYNSADALRIVQTDQNGVARTEPFVTLGDLNFSANMLVGGAGTYRLMFKSPPGAGDDYGEAGAITVEDNSGNPIEGTISSGVIPFTYDYDNNIQGGFAAGTDRDVVLIGVTPGHAKYTVFEGTLTRAQGLVFSLVAQTETAYAA